MNSENIASKIIPLASKWFGTTIFGGYVRDIIVGSNKNIDTNLRDLDIHFRNGSNMNSFVEFLKIFYEVVPIPLQAQSRYENKKNRAYNVVCPHTNKVLKIDCVCPKVANSNDILPLSVEKLDFEVNGLFIETNNNTPRSINTVPGLCLIDVINRIQAGRFSCLNFPRDLASGTTEKEKKLSEINKAIKLLLRAEKMVKRGWIQDLDAEKTKNVRYWHISKWKLIKTEDETQNRLSCYPVEDDKDWENIRTRILDQKTCSLCQNEFSEGHTVLIPPCGHAVHVACSDCGCGNDEEKYGREKTGIVGWFATKRRKLFEGINDVRHSCLECPTCSKEIFCPVAKTDA
tara:strand:+ start:2429 stop:3463 length:1035 start_codon:yes stop_codon:yes gene_type:complete